MKNYVQYRRDLHQIPEVSRQEYKTSEYIGKKLEKLHCTVEKVCGTGYTAFFDNGAKETIAFRGDMDALSIPEETGLEFASKNGCMHACAHDGHMAMMLSLCDYMEENLHKYKKFNVLVIFQPAEESIGGAKVICESGALSKHHVTKVFALHLWPKLEKNTIGTRPGPMMAKASEMTITVKGKSAHCARPDLGIDALSAAADMIAEINAMKKKEIPAGTEYLLHFGKMTAGDARNIVCENVHIEGSVRAFSEEVFQFMARRIREVCAEVDARYGTKTEVFLTEGYPPVNNDPALYEEYKKALAQAGVATAEVEKTVIAEDFSEYEARYPGVFGFLGLGDVPSLHNNKFDFDETVMETGIKAFVGLLDYFEAK
ncbi:M20 metallopeptidase family protein [Acidaminobacterium chupaoyuni]